MRKSKIKISKEGLQGLDHIIGRVYELEHPQEEETPEQEQERLENERELGGEPVTIDIDFYYYPKIIHLVEFLYQERLLFKPAGKDIEASEEHQFIGINVIRPFEAQKAYKSYLYASLFNPAKCDLNQLKRLIILLDEMHCFPCDVSEIFQYTDIKPNLDNLGADSLADFEDLIKQDLQFLHKEKVIPYLEIIEDYISIDYSDYAIKRLGWAIDLHFNEVKDLEISKQKKTDLKITLFKDRRIVLNDQFVLSKPNFNSENEVVFSFLYNNPNKKWTKQELESQINMKVHKSFDKIVENLGFKNDLRKVFWQVSSDSIRFNNPISTNTLEKMKLNHLRI
jgi:hypothetical protein